MVPAAAIFIIIGLVGGALLLGLVPAVHSLPLSEAQGFGLLVTSGVLVLVGAFMLLVHLLWIL